jgi:beta-lactam-binding protein with PASTA domain
MIGKVVTRDPPQGAEIACDSKVDIVVGVPKAAPAPELPKNGQPAKEEPAEAAAGDGNPGNGENIAPAGLPAEVEAAVEGAATGVINPPDVNNPPNGGGQG